MLTLSFTDISNEQLVKIDFPETRREFALEVAKVLDAGAAIRNVKLVVSIENIVYPPKEKQ